MTDEQKLVVARLLRAIDADREANKSYTFKLGEMESTRELHDGLRAKAKADLDAAMAEADKLIA